MRVEAGRPRAGGAAGLRAVGAAAEAGAGGSSTAGAAATRGGVAAGKSAASGRRGALRLVATRGPHLWAAWWMRSRRILQQRHRRPSMCLQHSTGRRGSVVPPRVTLTAMALLRDAGSVTAGRGTPRAAVAAVVAAAAAAADVVVQSAREWMGAAGEEVARPCCRRQGSRSWW